MLSLALVLAAIAAGTTGAATQPYPVLVEKPGARVYAPAAGQPWGRCPKGAQPVRRQDLDAARRAVLLAVPRLYGRGPIDNRLDVRGARARAARLGTADWTRGGLARSSCGSRVAVRTVAVGVGFPRITSSASMSSATFFVSRVSDGWIVWHQAH